MAMDTGQFAAISVPGGLKGSLYDVPLPELLQHLRVAEATGILSITSAGAKKALFLKAGRVVFANSNLPNDRLGELLLRNGKITVDEYEASIRDMSKGKRQGKALVEAGALTPQDFWSGVQLQVGEIANSLLHWQDGTFHFEESDKPRHERITVDLDIGELVLKGLREVDSSGPIQAHFPSGDSVLERIPDSEIAGLEPWERHVLDQIDGERTTGAICSGSEIGDRETLKVLYAFISTGMAREDQPKRQALDSDFITEDSSWSVITSFNQKYARIYGHLFAEVGPVVAAVLGKYLNELREQHPELLHGVELMKDGTLDGAAIERNVGALEGEGRHDRLVAVLNEFLYAELLAIKRTLGAEGEAQIVKELQAG